MCVVMRELLVEPDTCVWIRRTDPDGKVDFARFYSDGVNFTPVSHQASVLLSRKDVNDELGRLKTKFVRHSFEVVPVAG